MLEDDLSLARFLEPRGGQLALVMVGVALGVFSAVTVSIGLPRDGVLAPVWLANGIVVVVLSATSKKTWPFLLLAAAAGNVAAQVIGNLQGPARPFLVISNCFEDGLAATILRYGTTERPNLSRAWVLARLAGTSVIAGLSSAVVSSLLLSIFVHTGFGRAFETWSVAHILGLMTVTPCLMIVSQPGRYLEGRALTWRSASVSVFLLAVTSAVFGQTHYPILFLIPPALLLVSLELETFGAAAGVLIVEVFAIVSLYSHSGPMTLIHGDPIARAAIVQIFLLACLATSLPVAALNTRRKQAMETARRSEEKYRLIAENAGDMITQYSPTSEITFITPSCSHILGYRSEELIGRRALDMVHPDDGPPLKAYCRALADRRGVNPEPVQFRMQRRTGEWIWLEGQPKMFFHETSGELMGMQDVVRDVTSRKELEFKLSRAQSEAEAASVVKSEFMSNMSHELRTPLTSILGFASLLQNDEGLSEQSRRSIERIDGSSQALLTIVNDILDFSKLEAGHVEIQTTPTSISPLMQEALAMLEPQATSKGLTLTLSMSLNEAPELVSIAPSRVVQILTNLLGNAIKFTHAGKVSLTVVYEPGTQRLRFEVMDTGSGISDVGLARLFQRFSQVDGSTTRQFGGTGLGLAICKGLVDAMGGEIGARSQLGSGSTFWFVIPCPPAEAFDLPIPLGGVGSELSGLRILVGDATRAHAEVVRTMLTACGVEVTEAANGEDAAALAEEIPFDLILLNLRLPGLDGEAAAQAIRGGGGPNDLVPILALAGDAPDHAAVRTRGSPFDDCVDLPLVPQVFLETLSRWAHPQMDQAQREWA